MGQRGQYDRKILRQVLIMTSLSYLIIPTYFFNRENLFKLLILLVPFTSTSVFNITGGFWIQPSYIILLFIFIKYYLFANELFDKKILPIFFIVLTTVLLSNILVIFNSSVFIESTVLNKLNFFVDYSHRHLTFIIYLIVGFLFSIVVSNHYKASPNKLLNVYLISCLIVSGIIIAQYIMKSLNLPETIIYVLNNNLTFKSHMQILEGTNIYRFSGPGIEPSVVAKFIAPAFFIVLIKLNSIKYVFYLSVLLMAMLLTKSSTFYAGLFLSIIFIFLRQRNIRIIVMLAPIALILFVLILDKFESGSGAERAMVFLNNINYFMARPFLGNGYGILPNNDMISFVLASGGLVGAVAFIILLYHPFINRDKHFYEINYVFIIGIILQITSGLDYGNMQFYFFLSMILTTYLHKTNYKK